MSKLSLFSRIRNAGADARDRIARRGRAESDALDNLQMEFSRRRYALNPASMQNPSIEEINAMTDRVNQARKDYDLAKQAKLEAQLQKDRLDEALDMVRWDKQGPIPRDPLGRLTGGKTDMDKYLREHYFVDFDN